jgi:hypothetical protein
MRFRIEDVVAKGGMVVKVKNESDAGLGISIRDYSTRTSADGFDDAVVFLELNDGKPMLYVWADINSEEPTNVIDLSGAHVDRRLATFKGHYYFKDDAGAKTLISAFEMQALNANDLERKLLDEFWDPRLDAASCVPWPEYEIVS